MSITPHIVVRGAARAVNGCWLWFLLGMFVSDLYRRRRLTSREEPAAVGAVPGDVKGEQDQVRTDSRSDDRGHDGGKAAGCVEAQPRSNESAADRRRESGGLGRGGPVAV